MRGMHASERSMSWAFEVPTHARIILHSHLSIIPHVCISLEGAYHTSFPMIGLFTTLVRHVHHIMHDVGLAHVDLLRDSSLLFRRQTLLDCCLDQLYHDNS